MALAISTRKIEITPPTGTPMAGYGTDTPRLSASVHKPLYARCTVFWDNGFPNVIVSVDTLAFGPTLHQDIRNKVVALGVGVSDFVLSTSHTHNGAALTLKLNPFIAYNATPAQLTAIANFSTALGNTIVQLVQNTLNDARIPCTLDYKVGTANFAVNREGLPYVEKDVPILVARSGAGQPLAVLFSYGCHPVAAGAQTAIDPDYPGVAAELIESSTGAHAQFILGAAGDQNPSGTLGYPLSTQHGTSLGNVITSALATPGRALAGPISTDLRTVNLPLDITVTPANLAAVRAAYVTRSGNAALPSYYRRHAQTMIQQIDTNTFTTSVPLPMQVWKLTGNPGLRIAFSGGELVSGYAVSFRNSYGGSSKIWMAASCNEIPAYIPSDELLRKPSSYIAGRDTDFPGIAGGSMTVYAYLGHFRGKPTASSPDGVEQIYTNNLRSMLGAP